MKTPIASSSASLSRRDFLARAGLATAAGVLAPTMLAADAQPAASSKPVAPAARYDIGILEKWFFDGGNGGPLKYTPDEMAQTLDEIGLDLELTLRKQGQITP
jgi:hypothetical protein